jgi:DNA-binding SARP family transcriptional activator
LAGVFWPGVARPLALQNLRTACSTIRRALGNVVGMERVGDYFVASERLSLNWGAIVGDVDRFRRQVALAAAADAAGSLDDAIVHLRAAERLYGNGLFAGDDSEPAFLAGAQELAQIYAGVLARLSDALIEFGSPAVAREYAAKALKFGFIGRAGAAGTQKHLRFAAS